MLKKIISLLVLLALTALVVLFTPQAQQALRYLVDAHDWVAEILTEVFNGGTTGNNIRGMVALLMIPMLAGLIPALIYFLVRKRWLPCFLEIVWFVWLLQAGALIMIYSGGTPASVATPSKPAVEEPAPAPAAATPPAPQPSEPATEPGPAPIPPQQ